MQGDIKEIKEIVKRQENENKWRRVMGDFGGQNAPQLQELVELGATSLPAFTQPPVAPAPAAPAAVPPVQPGNSGASQAAHGREEVAVEQFLCGLKSHALLKDVGALWTAWSTGELPTHVRAGVKLPGGKSWKELDDQFHAKLKGPVHDVYRAWAGKVGGKQGPGVSFMGRSKRRELLKQLEREINDPEGPGEDAVLERVQAEIDENYKGILEYASARFGA